jgi:hypothetical protein
MASVAVGRAGAGIGASKSSRYIEFALLIPPLLACALAYAFREDNRKKRLVLVAFFFLCFTAFSNDWDFTIYRTTYERQAEGRACVQRALHTKSPASCPTVFPELLDPHLERAKRANAHLISRLLRETVE